MKRRIVIIALNVLIAVGFWFWFTDDGGPYVDPKTGKQVLVTISKDTVYFTEPLDEMGFPDFTEHLNLLAGKGEVTPEKNGALPLLAIFGPRPLGQAAKFENVQSLVKELGGELLPDDEKYYISHFTYIKERILAEHPELSNEEAVDQAIEMEALALKPWRSEELPISHDWLNLVETRRAIGLFNEMMKRESFYLPINSNSDGGFDFNNAFSHYPFTSVLHEVSRLLNIQIQRDLAEKHFVEAATKIDQLHWLARVSKKRLDTLDYVVRAGIESLGFNNEVILVQSEGVPAELIVERLTRNLELEQLDFVPTYETYHRMFVLSIVLAEARLIVKAKLGDESKSAKESLQGYRKKPFDFNAALTYINASFEETVPRRIMNARQRNGFAKVASHIELTDSKWDDVVGYSTKQVRGRQYGRSMFDEAMAHLGALMAPADRHETKLGLVRLVLAIEAYQENYGRYPDSLERLVPEYLKEIPVCQPSEMLAGYDLTEAGYRVFAVLEDGSAADSKLGLYYQSPGFVNEDEIVPDEEMIEE